MGMYEKVFLHRFIHPHYGENYICYLYISALNAATSALVMYSS